MRNASYVYIISDLWGVRWAGTSLTEAKKYAHGFDTIAQWNGPTKVAYYIWSQEWIRMPAKDIQTRAKRPLKPASMP